MRCVRSATFCTTKYAICFSLSKTVFIIEDCDIADYADGNTPCLSRKNIEEVLNGLENAPSNLSHWFAENELKGNASNCHLLITSGENVDIRKKGYYELIWIVN